MWPSLHRHKQCCLKVHGPEPLGGDGAAGSMVNSKEQSEDTPSPRALRVDRRVPTPGDAQHMEEEAPCGASLATHPR